MKMNLKRFLEWPSGCQSTPTYLTDDDLMINNQILEIPFRESLCTRASEGFKMRLTANGAGGAVESTPKVGYTIPSLFVCKLLGRAAEWHLAKPLNETNTVQWM